MVAEKKKLAILCQIESDGCRCREPACGFIDYQCFDVVLAACAQHMEVLTQQDGVEELQADPNTMNQVHREAREWERSIVARRFVEQQSETGCSRTR